MVSLKVNEAACHKESAANDPLMLIGSKCLLREEIMSAFGAF